MSTSQQNNSSRSGGSSGRTFAKQKKQTVVLLGDFPITESSSKEKRTRKKKRNLPKANQEIRLSEVKNSSKNKDKSDDPIIESSPKILSSSQSMDSPVINDPGINASTFDFQDLDFSQKQQALLPFFMRKTQESMEIDALRRQWIELFKVIHAKERRAEERTLEESDLNESAIEGGATIESYPYYTLQGKISLDLKSWIKTKIDIYMNENPPPGRVCFFVMGSLATELATFYSDIEMGALVDTMTPELMAYVGDLVHNISVKIRFLHESEKGVRLDEADLSPIHLTPESYKANKSAKDFTLTNTSFEGSGYLIAPPDIMALYPFVLIQRFEGYESAFYNKYVTTYNYLLRKNKIQPPEYDKSDLPLTAFWKSTADIPFYSWPPHDLDHQRRECDHIGQIARAMKTTDYLTGDRNLYTSFLEQRNKYMDEFILTDSYMDRTTYKPVKRFSTLRQRFVADINFHLSKFLNKNDFLKMGAHTSHIDIKKDIFRPIEQILLNYAFAFNWGTNNLFEILDLLQKNNIFGASSVQKIKNYLNFASYLRLWEQYLVKDNAHDICLKKEVCSMNMQSEEEQVIYWKTQIEALKPEIQMIDAMDNESERNTQRMSLEQRKSNALFQLQMHENLAQKYRKAQTNRVTVPGSKEATEILSTDNLRHLVNEFHPLFQIITTSQVNPFFDIQYTMDLERILFKNNSKRTQTKQRFAGASSFGKSKPGRSNSTSSKKESEPLSQEIIVKITQKLP